MSIAEDPDRVSRARRYLELAEQAARYSRSFTRPEMREACLNIARSWVQLAIQATPAAPLGKIAWLLPQGAGHKQRA